MLVTRHSESEQNPWSISKFDSIYAKPSSPRMSNFDAPLSTQADWQGQYSFLPPAESNLFGHSYDHHHANSNDASSTHDTSASQPRTGNVDLKAAEASVSSPLNHSRSVDPLGLRQPKQPSPIPEHPSEASGGDMYTQKPAETTHQDEGAVANVADAGTAPAVQQADMTGSSAQTGAVGGEDGIGNKEEEEEAIDDDEMVEGESGEQNSQPQTAAERTAQRRKMKRFRLTHQQTRFLMSEFAKQPHPDAAHRERLSREIPGLSPRQVQVWFQNRRAKIKRLTADDRDRMMKMRAVPDDFDNVGALHSPYGAPVHGLGNPMASPVDFGTPSYADHMMRPLMVDVRRPEGEDHMSPTGLSPAFNSIGFPPSATMSNPDILSPLSPTSTDRYGGYSSHLSTTPLSAGARATSNPFARQNSMDATIMGQRHGIRPLQPLQLRETMTRSRSDNLQSPLRTSMSWKGDSIDYTTYPGGGASPQLTSQPGSVYRTDTMNSSSSYDASSYGNTAVQSPTHMAYPGMSSTLQQAPQNRARLRAASASTLPLSLDLRNQYRGIGSTGAASPANAGGVSTAGGTPRPPAISTAGASPYGSAYTTSFPSAPLTAPIDFALPRTATTTGGGLRTDYSMPQMSAPLNPPADFSQASQSFGSAARTPMRDTFSAAGTYGQSTPTAATATSTTPGTDPSHQQPYGNHHIHSQNQQQQQSHSHHHNPRPEDYGSDALGSASLQRKHSFTTAPITPVSGVGTQAYGSTA